MRATAMQVSYSAPLHIVEARKIVPVYCLTKLCRLEGRKRWEMATLHVGILEGHDSEQRIRTDIRIGARGSSTSGQNRRARSPERAGDRDASPPSRADG